MNYFKKKICSWMTTIPFPELSLKNRTWPDIPFPGRLPPPNKGPRLSSWVGLIRPCRMWPIIPHWAPGSLRLSPAWSLYTLPPSTRFFEKINKMDKPSTRLTKKKRRHKLPELRMKEETSLLTSGKLKKWKTNVINNFIPIN